MSRRLTGILIVAFTAAGAASAAELDMAAVNSAEFDAGMAETEGASPAVLRAQILLDRADASPGVIDGIYGENVAKAVSAFERVNDLAVDGKLDEAVWQALTGAERSDVLVEYTVTAEDMSYDFVKKIPDDYAEMAEMDRLGYTSVEEMLAERFHMDQELLSGLNAGTEFAEGATIIVADIDSPGPQGEVVRIEADKAQAQIRAYDAEDRLLVAYPATIGSEENPSPSGIHEVKAVATDPIYYYNPAENFQQGDNSEPLEIPPGPNNPVGTVWIDLSEPTYGIHGTPVPDEIDKTASHGCVRLTNWDAEELVKLVQVGAKVEFLSQ